jgi:hypothetical protein
VRLESEGTNFSTETCFKNVREYITIKGSCAFPAHSGFRR